MWVKQAPEIVLCGECGLCHVRMIEMVTGVKKRSPWAAGWQTALLVLLLIPAPLITLKQAEVEAAMAMAMMVILLLLRVV